MTLRKPCEHGRYDEHYIYTAPPRYYEGRCAGGEFLPEDALVIEKEHGEWPAWAMLAAGLGMPFSGRIPTDGDLARHTLDALAADQVGEPG